jgi:hypothetical protein
MVTTDSISAINSLLAIDSHYSTHLREQLVDWVDQQHLRCSTQPFDASLCMGCLSPQAQQSFYPLMQHLGAKGLQLLPHLLRYQQQCCGGVYASLPHLAFSGATGIADSLVLGGSLVLIASDVVPVCALDSLQFSEMLLIPHRFAFSPNAIWCLERGDAHPLVQATADLQLWSLAAANRSPDFYWVPDVAGSSSGVLGLELFVSESDAQLGAKAWHEPGMPALSPVPLLGRELLRCLSCADVVTINDVDWPITPAGALAMGKPQASTAEVLSAMGC